jgi:RNA polymerase sigma factor (sigma-70 family)
MSVTAIDPAAAATPPHTSDDNLGGVAGEDLAALVRRAQRGEERAAIELMQRCRPFVAHTARRYLWSADDVDDVIQEVWLCLLRELGRIRSPELILGWLKQVTAHAAIRLSMRSSRMVTGGEIEELASEESTEETGLAGAALDGVQSAIDAALCRLRPVDRALIERLMAVDRPDYSAIGRELDRPVGSLGPTRQRILARLRGDPSIARLRVVA